MSTEDPKRRFRPGGAARHRTLSRGIDGDKTSLFPNSRARHRQIGGWRKSGHGPETVYTWWPGDRRAYWWNTFGVTPDASARPDFALTR